MDSYDFLLTLFKTLVASSILLWLVRKLRDLKKTPPGPWGLPFVGLLPTLSNNNSILELAEYKQKYGEIFSMRVGHFDTVVISDYKLIIEALKRDEFQGRPDFEMWEIRNGGFKDRGILFSDGVKSWQEQRRFALRNLRDFGFGKESMEGMMLHEVDELVKLFKKNEGNPMNLRNNFNCSVFNSLWYIVSGERFELDDTKFHEMLSLFSGHLDKLPLFSSSHLYPWPAKYNLVRRGLWKQSQITIETLLGHIDEIIDQHLKTYDSGVTRDFVDVYLHQHYGGHSEGTSFSKEEGLKHLRITLLDLFVAGTETSSTTLHWAVLWMCKFPEIQKKLQEEIDSVIGKTPVTREDRPRLPYLEAFTNEVHRKSTLIPLSVYHKVLQDCEFAGYFFKKGTIVYPNLYDAHHDEGFWGDPETFRPERFLDPTGTKLVSKEALMPFSTGKRVCLGETLARDTLYYFLAGLVQNFSFELDPSSADVETDTPKPNFIKSPYEFQVLLKSR